MMIPFFKEVLSNEILSVWDLQQIKLKSFSQGIRTAAR